MTAAKRFFSFEAAQVQVYGSALSFRVLVKNLSATGAYLEIDPKSDGPQKGDLIRCSLFLDTIGKTHELDAEVIWTKGQGFGIHFLNKSEFLEKLIKTTLQS